MWCMRRVGDKDLVTLQGLLKTTTAAMSTDKGKNKAKKSKKKRDEQLSRVGRGDLVEAEKALLFSKPTDSLSRIKCPHVKVRVCSLQPNPKKDWPNGHPLAADPVISGEMPGHDAAKVEAGTAIDRARHRAVQVNSPESTSRADRGRRRGDDDTAALKSKIRRLEERVDELEKSTVPRVSWANAMLGLLPDRPLFTIPQRKLHTWMRIMHANHVPKCWVEHVKENEARNAVAIAELGFENACLVTVMVCSTGCSQEHAAWASGLSKTHGKAHAQILLGCVFRATLVVINYHYKRTVAQPPHLAQLDRDALPAFESGMEPGMEDNLLTMDASNVSIEGKIHDPIGDGKSFSACHGANCGKFELVSDKAGNPAWCSLVYGGASSEKSIVIEDNFGEWFGRFKTAMVGQAGQEFTMGMLADKGAWPPPR